MPRGLRGVVGGAIGLGQEAYAHHKASRSKSPNPPADAASSSSHPRDGLHSNAATSSSQEPLGALPPPYTETAHDSRDGDESPDTEEANWALDDAVTHPDAFGEEARGDVPQMLAHFHARHEELSDTTPPAASPGLPAPVILPQRRPEHKDRGFVRAYAPDLAACGISQAAWLDFLDGFHAVIKYHPAFHAVNLAALAGNAAYTAAMGPSVIAHVAGMAVHTGLEAGRRGFIQYKTNEYLDGMNAGVFGPRGLHAMIMVYEPGSDHVLQEVDPAQAINRAVGARVGGQGGKLASASGTTLAGELPEVAPLVFPELDALPDAEKQSKMQRANAFLRDYFDRRAQAEFAAKNPDSKLNLNPQFASTLGDPTHPSHNQSLLGMATGGRLGNRQGPVASALGRARERREHRKEHSLRAKAKKKLLQQHVLYLMVVNLPTEDEIALANQIELH